MIATLKFNLPEEDNEFYNATNGIDYYCALWDVDQYCRGKIKYDDISAKEELLLQEIRDIIHDRVDLDRGA